MCVVCGVWIILCFNFVTTQKYTAMEKEFKDLQEKTEGFERMTQVRVVCVCGVCVVCVCVCAV